MTPRARAQSAAAARSAAPAPGSPGERETAAGGVRYRLELPRWDTAWEPLVRRGRPVLDRAGKPRKRRRVWDALHGNARPAHWGQRSAATAEVIQAVTLLARAQGLHHVRARFVTVELVWNPGDRRRADSLNLWPLVKAAGDAIARGRSDLPGLHLVPDDTDAWMVQRARIARPPLPAGLWLDIDVEVLR